MMAEPSIGLLSILDSEGNPDDSKMEVPLSVPSSCENGSSLMDSARKEILPNHMPCLLRTLASLSTSETGNSVNTKAEVSNLEQERVISHVANCSEEVFLRIQHRDEPSLTNLQKREIIASLLESSPANFLVRFGKYLEPSHLNYFNQYRNSYEVSCYLQQFEKQTESPQMHVKNRRFQALNEMIKEGKYFCMEEMRKRNPILFHELVEKYMTPEEKRLLEQEQPKECNLSTIFMAHIDGDKICSKRRNEQLANQSAWDEELAEEEEEDEDIDQDEKKFFRDEFISGITTLYALRYSYGLDDIKLFS